MSRIGSVITGFEQQLLRSLAAARSQQAIHSLRLTTGKKISKPADDPAAFFQISSTETRLKHINHAIDRVTAASYLAAESQLTVDLIRTQLETIRTKLLEDENGALTSMQRTANQTAVDTAIGTIDSLATKQLTGGAAFDGQSDYRVSGRNGAQVSAVEVYRSASVPLSGSVTSAAQRATLTYTGAAGLTTAAATFTLSGKTGSIAVTVSSGQTLTSLAATINSSSHKTGVIADVTSDTLTFRSVEYGSGASAQVTVTSGTFTVTGGDASGRDRGADVVALVNGRSFTGDGNRVTYTDNSTNVSIEFSAGFVGTFDTLTIDGNSALQFALSTDSGRKTKVGLRTLLAAQLGGVSGRLNQLVTGQTLAGLGANTSQAIRVVDEAISQLTLVEAITDSFADITIATSSSLLTSMKAVLNDSLTTINGIDVAEEENQVDYYQSLYDNAVSALAIEAQQRQKITLLLSSLAGLT